MKLFGGRSRNSDSSQVTIALAMGTKSVADHNTTIKQLPCVEVGAA